MNTTDKTSTTASSTEDTQLAGVNPAALDDVTGGCAACGQTGAAHVAPTTDVVKPQNVFGSFAAR